MTVRIVERGTVVELSGPAREIFESLSLMPDIAERITLCVNGNGASACWSAGAAS
jgi:hypothetical protein